MRRARLLLVISAFGAALIVVELLLRNLGGVFHDNLTQLDAVRGWTLRPHAAGWMRDEATLWVEINSDGLRDREHARTASPATIRVAVLGDSYMQGQNVPLEKTFAAFLERELDGCLSPRGVRAETLNFGVSGYGTAQEWLTYLHHARRYQPDIVLLAFYTGNDVYDNHRALNPSAVSELSPYFVLRDGQLERDRAQESEGELRGRADREPWWRRGRIFLTERLRMAQLVYAAWAEFRHSSADTDDSAPAAAAVNCHSIYRRPVTAEEIEAWAVTEALVARLAADVRGDGADFWLMTLSTAEQVDPDVDARTQLAKELGVETLFYPDDRIAALARALGIPVIALAREFAERSAREGLYLHGGYNAAVPAGSGHWNETANALAARIAAARLCAASASPARPPLESAR